MQGRGKTRVLIDRVARLLLDGAAPQNILCLTYTKAAASEMQNRLFETLGKWAMLPEDTLRDALAGLTGGAETHFDQLAEARRLFAKAVETPGGLRIQTIHSFCSSILRRFPLEANVSPQFTEMDDRRNELLLDECLEEMAERHPNAFLSMARILHGGDMRPLAASVSGARDAFRQALGETALRTMLGLSRDLSMDDVLADVFQPDTGDLLKTVADAMHVTGGKTDLVHAPRLLAARTANLESLEILEGVFLHGAGAAIAGPFTAKIGKYPMQVSRKTLDPDTVDALDTLMGRIELAREPRLALTELARNLALHRFAERFLPIYAHAKAERGWLDFDDLILKARDLLTDPQVAQWVLYRLDGGIDHILVDEAQDTSPVQWQMIEALAQESMAGDGTRALGERTIFVVGDKKQSIYSFQGADPEGFDRMYGRFADRLGATDLQRLEMRHSFRSSAAILTAVDTTFADQEVAHIAFHDALPGRVDIWPLVEPEGAADPLDFDDPVDLVSPRDANVLLAERIAAHIKEMIRTESVPSARTRGEARPIHAGDILILFRSRGSLFDATIRACKAAGIPMAGADRLTLTSELAVKDIVALLSFLATPEDSLSLAAALKSPLLGWDERALFKLAAQREERHLWETLRRRADLHPDTMAVLTDLRDRAGYLRPYELIERVLTRHHGRAKLVGRLGAECEEALDALLTQALNYERMDIPSLTGFLTWLGGDDIQIKRQSEGRSTNLRIMTIHGAKGLEAPIVILPDTMGKPPDTKQMLWPMGDDRRILRQSKDRLPASLQAARAEIDTKQAAERDRLLYVAMTRAQFWLIVAGAGAKKDASKRWYGKISDAMDQLDHIALPEPAGARRYQVNDWRKLETPRRPLSDSPALHVATPDWIDQPADQPAKDGSLLNPSLLGGAKALPGEGVDDSEDALLRGSELHVLLEHLPPDAPDRWDALAGRLLPQIGHDARTRRLAEARAVLGNEELRTFFTSDAQVEVPVVAPHPSGRTIVGAIDRLIVQETRVLAIDYKSNRVVPTLPQDVPEGLLRQMGAYAFALGEIYPGKRIDTALLWTSSATLMPLPNDLVRNAFAQSVDLDGPRGAA